MYRYPPALAELSHGDAERAARCIAYLHDDASAVIEVFAADGVLLARTVTGVTGCLDATAAVVLEGSPIDYERAPQASTLGGRPALSGPVRLRWAQPA